MFSGGFLARLSGFDPVVELATMGNETLIAMISQAEYLTMLARTSKAAPQSPAHDAPESELHDKILNYCESRGWICFHGSMAHRSRRTCGEPDCTILADKSRVFFVELKSKAGKLRPEQLTLSVWAEKLGHKIHCCRSMEDFTNLIASK